MAETVEQRAEKIREDLESRRPGPTSSYDYWSWLFERLAALELTNERLEEEVMLLKNPNAQFASRVDRIATIVEAQERADKARGE